MLQELLLSLSGYPSPLFDLVDSVHTVEKAADASSATRHSTATLLTTTERALLAPLARLASLNARLQTHTTQIASSHPSIVCRAVASAIYTGSLAQFQQHVIDTERALLRRDAAFVANGASVPLTALVGEFAPWIRRMEWLWAVLVRGYILGLTGQTGDSQATAVSGAGLIDLLRAETISGYTDIETLATSLATVAELAWLKQVSAWALYGRLPSFGTEDFFVRPVDDDGGFASDGSLLPSFVTSDTASSMLFIGKSLAHIRSNNMSPMAVGLQPSTHVAEQLKILSGLSFPIEPAAFTRAINAVRLSLSRHTLQKLLPLSRVVEALDLLRKFLLLERGEFAVALIQEADERVRSRWHGHGVTAAASNKPQATSASGKQDGEAAAILTRTWAALAALQGRHAVEDESIELARSLLRLEVPHVGQHDTHQLFVHTQLSQTPIVVAQTPFQNLLLPFDVSLTLRIPPPLDLFLSATDLAIYSAINAYLLAIRRAHMRLTNLWKMTSLRRHHPAPPGPRRGSLNASQRLKVALLRKREANRTALMRGPWVTCSAAVFLLAEMEAYLQGDVVAGVWNGFLAWLTGSGTASDQHYDQSQDQDYCSGNSDEEPDARGQPPPRRRTAPPPHDPQTLTIAHQTYLAALVHHLVLASPSFTDALYSLLAHIDGLVGLVQRLHAIWNAVDLENDAGVVDAFVDLESEERDVIDELGNVQVQVRKGVVGVVDALRELVARDEIRVLADVGVVDDGRLDSWKGTADDGVARGRGAAGASFVPPRIGGVDRLLLKLDFGAWFSSEAHDEDAIME